MKSVKFFLLTFAFTSVASAATLQTMYVPPAKDGAREKQAPMPAPAETKHYATNAQGQVTRG